MCGQSPGIGTIHEVRGIDPLVIEIEPAGLARG